jgi:hypothetical protein
MAPHASSGPRLHSLIEEFNTKLSLGTTHRLAPISARQHETSDVPMSSTPQHTQSPHRLSPMATLFLRTCQPHQPPTRNLWPLHHHRRSTCSCHCTTEEQHQQAVNDLLRFYRRQLADEVDSKSGLQHGPYRRPVDRGRKGADIFESRWMRAHQTPMWPHPSHPRPHKPGPMVTFKCNHRSTTKSSTKAVSPR